MKTFSLGAVLLVLSLTFFIFQSNQKSFSVSDKENEAKEKPNDWFFRQRAYPYSLINQEAYKAGIKKAIAQRKAAVGKASIWEFEGPTNIGGRITDVELLPGNTHTLFIGAASGGVFKSEDAGQTWYPIFDEMPSLSIGDIAISQSDPDVIYVGTGEANAGGGSLAYDGLGVFKSTDGGLTWQYTGLEDCGSVGRIAVDPTNPDVVYVAAMGRLFANGSQRGIFKTTDGGQTWEQKLFISDSTGAIDVVINTEHPDTVFAAMWERVRRPNKEVYGGETSGIYRSTDGGETWTELTNGLPTNGNDKGRIGIDLSASKPSYLYAVYADKIGYFKGVYHSTDNGDSWYKKDNGLDEYVFASYGWWFGRIKADPNAPNTAYLIGFNLYRTINGGNSWSKITDWGVHVDQHALAINSELFDTLYLGNDGGLYISNSSGVTWTKNNTLPITQFYSCEVDEQHPERIYGGTQDNGTNRTVTGSADDWYAVLGGDGMNVLVDPVNNNYAYAGYQYGNFFRSTDGGGYFSPAMSGLSGNDRYNWKSPIVLDPADPSILYCGSNRLYKSVNRASSWQVISGDLTNGDEPGNITYNTLTTISVSPVDHNIIYTGSDDGNVHVTVDGGASWSNISGSLPNRWVTSVTADPFNENRVYVTFSGYRWDEYLPHVFRSDNKGMTWEDISSNLPEIPVNELVVDPQDTGYLYLATDAGVYYSENNGAEWQPAGSGMPVLVVNDLRLHNPSRKLFAATYGRGIYSLDLDVLTGVDDLKKEEPLAVRCYPNPFKELLNIKLNKTKGEAHVFVSDLQGRVVADLFSGIVKQNKTLQWQANNLPAGVYFVNVISEKGRVSKKVVLE